MNEKIKKTIRVIDKGLDRSILMILIIVFLIGCYGVFDILSVYAEAQDKSILKFKPSEGQLLTQELSGNVAWITLDDSTIDYPIMQGNTNETYLNTDPYGKYSLSGSIFLDYRNSADFSDDYSLVYGHHMEKNMMFGSIDQWLDEDYFASHRTGTLTTENRIYQLKVIAVCEEYASTVQLFQPTDIDVSETFSYIKEHSMYLDETVDLTHIVALSTCKYPDTEERTMLFCEMTLVYEGNNTELDQTKTKKLLDTEKQVGNKVYKDVEPLQTNKTILDTVLSLIGWK